MSYNSLMGLGSHSEDASLERWYPMMDNAASTTVVDQSSNGNNGAVVGGSNTNAVDVAGPNSFATSALRMYTTDYIDLPNIVLSGDNATFLGRIKAKSDPLSGSYTGFARMGEPLGDGTTVASNSHHPRNFTKSCFNSFWRGDGSGTNDVNRVGEILVTDLLNTWHSLVVKSTPGASGWKYRVDGVLERSETGITGVWAESPAVYLGTSEQETGKSYGEHDWSEVAVFDRHLSDAEDEEWADGPEPIVTSGSDAISGTETEGEILSASGATWGLDAPWASGSNGTVTYAYQWTRSNDGTGTGEADIAGATSSTYTLAAADVGKFIRRRVRASNDGGFDSGADHNSNFTGAIASDSITITPDALTHSHVIEAPTITQVHEVAPASLTHSHSLDQATITQVHEITPDALTHSHTVEAPGITQVHAVAPDALTHSHSIESPTITESYSIAPDSVTHSHAVEAPAITQVHEISPDSLTHSHSLDSPVITQAHEINPDSLDHNHELDQPGITQTHSIAPGSLTHSHTVDSPSITQSYQIAPDSLTHSHSVDSPAITQTYSITPNSLTHSHTLDSPSITQTQSSEVTTLTYPKAKSTELSFPYGSNPKLTHSYGKNPTISLSNPAE